MKIVLATKNAHKVEEIKAMLAGLTLEIMSLADFPDIPEVEETGTTFAENASLKASAISDATGLIALADDSGLEVDALGGDPGVYSNRFAGTGATDRDKYMRIVKLLADIPEPKRSARFRAAVAIATPAGDIHVVEGKVEGTIAHEPKGEKGFGYDPIFYIPQLGKTMAQLEPWEKNLISHRARALEAAKNVLIQLISNKENPGK